MNFKYTIDELRKLIKLKQHDKNIHYEEGHYNVVEEIEFEIAELQRAIEKLKS